MQQETFYAISFDDRTICNFLIAIFGFAMSVALIHSILSVYKVELGDSYARFSNHACRVFHYAVLLSHANEAEQKQLAIASAFHDIGIWTANTFDYLEPSVRLAKEYLQQNGLSECNKSVEEIITQHHKLSAFKPNRLAECFRKADLIDLSFGLFRFGLESQKIAETNQQYPSLGFHRFIAKEILKNAMRHPLNPLPIVKW